MKTCKKCKNDFEPRIGYNGITASKCDKCLLAHKRAKQKEYAKRARARQTKKHKNRENKDGKNLAELIKLADLIFSRYIRKRDKGRCITCGVTGDEKIMQNGHFIPRASMAVRYDERNCNTQCKSCNEFGNGELVLYRTALMYKYGEKTVLELESKKDLMKKYTPQELYDIIDTYQT